MQYLLHDLVSLPLADRLNIIEQAINSLSPEGESRYQQLQQRLDILLDKVSPSKESSITSTLKQHK